MSTRQEGNRSGPGGVAVPGPGRLESRHTELDAVRKQRRIELEDRLQFETFLADASARLANAEFDGLETSIADVLTRLGTTFALERVDLVCRVEREADFRVTRSWEAPGIADAELADVVVGDRFPWITKTMLRGETVRITCMDDFPAEAKNERSYSEEHGLSSAIFVPIEVQNVVLGFLVMSAVTEPRAWTEEVVRRMGLLCDVIGNAMMRTRTMTEKQEALEEIRRLQERLERENIYLRDQIDLDFKHEKIVGRSRGLRNVLKQVEQVASTTSTVLIQGETGTGKELVAHEIHRLSDRASRPLIKVNCAALPSNLVESELFGREKGAYTGALSRQTGRFEIADGSTIFLDEIGELPIELQAKLLRVLQDGEFERLGSTRTRKVDARVIAATNRDLEEAVRKGGFREDLFYRLNVFPITVPPLRERQDDILPLAWFFLEGFGRSMGPTIETIPRQTAEALLAYSWSGNVRELRNVLERAVIRSRTGEALRVDLSCPEETVLSEELNLADVQKRHILRVLDRTGWKVRGRDGAAALLGLKPTTLEGRMAKLGIKRRASGIQ